MLILIQNENRMQALTERPQKGFVIIWLLAITLVIQSLYLMTDFQIQNYRAWFVSEQGRASSAS